jgi:hypothetical protein
MGPKKMDKMPLDLMLRVLMPDKVALLPDKPVTDNRLDKMVSTQTRPSSI